VLLLCTAWQGSVRADARAEMPSAALFPTTTPGSSGSTEALDAAIQTALGALDMVRVTARPGLDLVAIQLAIDCVGEDVRCLTAVAEQSGTQLLIAPTLERADGATSLRLLKFDPQSQSPIERVVRKAHGEAVSPELIAAVPEMLRELFGLSRPAPQPVAARDTPAADTTEQLQPSVSPELPPPLTASASVPTHEAAVPFAPLVLAAAGAVVFGGGIIAGVMQENTQDEYDALIKEPPMTTAEVDAANSKRTTGDSQAVLATVLLSVGGAAIAAGGVWLALELNQSSERKPPTAFVPLLAPGQLGLAVVHCGAAL
jgi:hypothetical protein